MTTDTRTETLNNAIQSYAKDGWHVVSQTDTQATVEKGKRVNHLLHLVLTLLTLGAWAVVWLVVAVIGGVKHRLITVTDAGDVTVTKV